MNEENTTDNEMKISVSDLVIGMYVAHLDKDWQESSFMFQGFLIEKRKQVKQLQKECEFVYVDTTKSSVPVKLTQKVEVKAEKKSFFDKLRGKKEGTGKVNSHTKPNKLDDIIKKKISTKVIVAPKRQVSFDEEMDYAKNAVARNTHLIKDFMMKVKSGGTIDLLVAKKGIQKSINSVLRSPDTILLMSQLQNKHQSTWQHSMNVSVLAINLGRYLNLEEDELMTLGLCGMLLDIGKLLISKEDLVMAENKKDLIESHTTLGRNLLLKSSSNLSKIVSEVAYTHHERLDGKGFPQGLKGKQISAYARMISIVDTYDTLTIDKPNKKGLTHYEAMSQILAQVGTHFDETLVNSFNQCIGTYPVGSIVEMNTGEVAMVVESNSEQRLRPKIVLLTTADKKPRAKHVVNLADHEDPMSDASFYSIRSIIRKDTYQT
ncbi:MAG: DUF3391 domain-containing protein [Methylococcaceae bacterium]|nr:DUF3391 domain-containing protein [Methylococcaceae bacterium]